MANINQTVNSIGTGVRFQFADAGDSYRIFSSVRVESTNNLAITGSVAGVSLYVDGSVQAAFTAITLSAGHGTVLIGETGAVSSKMVSPANSTIVLSGGDNTLGNHGTIHSPDTLAAVFAGGNNDVLNTGSIGGSSGIFLGLAGGANDHLINEGRIAANNSGDGSSDYRFNNGVYAEGLDTIVVNRAGGRISAISSEGAGVAFGVVGGGSGADGSIIENHGLIQSRQWYGVDFANMADAETASLENFGTIKGGSGSFRGNASGEFILNAGTMIGDVELGGGDDVFEGAKGSVKGAVLGGAGDDYINAGKGNQSINGGLDDDILVGGTGKDTLFGDVGIDTFVFRTGFGRDIVQDFTGTGVSHDLIDLSGLKDIKNFSDLENNHLEKHGSDMWIVAKGGDVMILKNVASGDLDATDFIF